MSIRKLLRDTAHRYPASLLCAFVVAGIADAQTAPGTLDPNWGSNGIVTTNVVGFNDVSRVTLLQKDGKVVVAGYCTGSSIDYGFCIARYNTNGTRDLQFNGTGTLPGTNAIVPSGGSGVLRRISAGQIQSDGKIVLAGECGQTDFCVARFNADGTVDTSFNSIAGGVSPATPGYNIVSTNFSTPSNRIGLVYDSTLMAIQSDGRIVLATECGFFSGGSTCLMRFTAAGGIDSTFTGSSRASVTPSIRPIGLTALGNDRLLVAGICSGGLCLTTYNADGTQYDAKVLSLPAALNGFSLYGLAVRGDGKLALGGSNSSNRFAALLVNVDGTFESSFGVAGVSFVDVPGVSSVSTSTAVAAYPDGRIVVGSTCQGTNAFSSVPCATRFTADGRPDISFGAPSYSYSTVNGDNYRVGLALQPDGKILLSFQKNYPSGVNVPDVADFTTIRINGGATYPSCNTDVDGDGRYLATVDGLILTRVMLGFSGADVLGGIAIDQANARRKDWPSIKKYLVEQCNLNTR